MNDDNSTKFFFSKLVLVRLSNNERWQCFMFIILADYDAEMSADLSTLFDVGGIAGM